MSDPRAFYDGFADSYHLIFEDWDRSINRQGDALAAIIQERWPSPGRLVLDVAAGIGTQAIGLAARGFHVVGSDVSPRAVARAQRETRLRRLPVMLAAADFRVLPFRSGSGDVVIACDNALPHLLSLGEIAQALREMTRCARPGGGVVISMRDYGAPPPPGTIELRPYGEREWNGRRVMVEQEWRWTGPTYQIVLRVRSVDGRDERRVEVETTYFAVRVSDVLGLMVESGLRHVERVDGTFYQPLLLGTAPGPT